VAVDDGQALDWSSRLIARVMAGPVPVLLIFVALVVGAVALWITPREEEP
jgi:hypothetical protein